jgi:putative flavoprotein involved in K+ transport
VYGALLTPYQGAAASPAGEAVREALNAWIKAGGGFDGVIDFATPVADPANPLTFAPAFNDRDHLLTRLALRVLFHHVLTAGTPIGRRFRPRVLHGGGPLIRLKPADLATAGIKRVPRVTGVLGGRPQLEDGRQLEPANVVWCNGFDPGFAWIDLPVFGPDGLPQHEGGVVAQEPGLYFVGLHFLYAFSSEMIQGVGRDAARIARLVVARTKRRSASSSKSAA